MQLSDAWKLQLIKAANIAMGGKLKYANP